MRHVWANTWITATTCGTEFITRLTLKVSNDATIFIQTTVAEEFKTHGSEPLEDGAMIFTGSK
jgi:hypothetical protein